jgi:hypothetical protein
MTFPEWLKSVGCQVNVYQEDDGSGYSCMNVTIPDGIQFDITVNT